MSHFPLRAVCRLAVGVVIAVLVVRTWLVMGLVVPVTVAGSSMAPTLLGPHCTFRCDVCGHRFPVGLDELPPDDRAICPHCGRRDAVAVAAADRGGEHLAIDRAAFTWRSPRRWELVVFHCPEMADQLCVKRVVGLPGETVTLADGDVWIDGRPACKTLADQRAVRQLVDRLDAAVRIPLGRESDAQLPKLDHWQWEPTQEPGDVRWLVYHHPGGPITDDLSYNQRASHSLHAMRDVMLSFQARLDGDGQLRLRASGGGAEWVVTCDAGRRSVQLCRGTRVVEEASLPPHLLAPHTWTEWTFSLLDRQVLVAIGDRTVMVVPDDARPRQSAADVRDGKLLAIDVAGLRGELRDLAVWRDAYYESRPGDRPTPLAGGAGRGWRLGPHEYFVLGDNAAVSDDSRSWLAGPGLDAKLVIGKPLGVR